MKKIILFLTSLSLLALSSCFTQKEESPYAKYESDVFSIEYPKGWEMEVNSYPFRPFSAASDKQIVVVATRLIGDTPLDSFVAERINFFQENYWGFRLISQKVEGDNAIIHYANEDDATGDHLGTIMRIAMHDTHFYGIDCSYETDAEKDTVEHLINSFSFK